MKFVNAKYSYRNPNKLNIGGLTKSVCSVVIDEGSGAVLIGDDSMYASTTRSSRTPNDHDCRPGHKAMLACAQRRVHPARYGFLAQWQRAQRQSTSSLGPGFANMQRRLRNAFTNLEFKFGIVKYFIEVAFDLSTTCRQGYFFSVRVGTAATALSFLPPRSAFLQDRSHHLDHHPPLR